MRGMVTPARLQGVPGLVSDPQPEIEVKRKRFRGDHHLPVFDIKVRQSA